MKVGWQLALVLVVTAGVYWPILGNGLVIDDHNFLKWEGIKSVNLVKVFLGDVPVGHEGVYRPLRGLLYQIYYQFWGTNPVGYHLHSLLTHLVATVLVYLVIERLGVFTTKFYNRLLAFFSALFFGLLPVHVESIAYMAASMEITGIVLALGAIYAYQRSKRKLSVGLAIAAYFTYEIALVLPLLILLMDWCFGKLRTDNWEKRWQRYWPFWAGAGVYAVVRWGLLGIGARGPYLADSPYLTFLTMGRVLVKYLELMVWPMKLAVQQMIAPGIEAFVYRGYATEAIRAQRLWTPEVGLALLAIMSMVVVAWRLRQRHMAVTLGIGWWFVGLLPVMEIVPQGSMMNEKVVYLASLGLILILAYGLVLAWQGWWKWLVVVGVVILTGFYGWRTYQRTGDWKDEARLWTKDIETYPDSAYAYYSLGNVYLAQGNYQDARENFSQAVEHNPQMAVAEASIARTYEAQGDKDKEVEYYQRALVIDPRFYEVAFNLGNIKRDQGKIEEAKKFYSQALEANPGFEAARTNLQLLMTRK